MNHTYDNPYEQLQTDGLAPEIYHLCDTRYHRDVERAAENIFIALKAMTQEATRNNPNRSFYGSRIAQSTIMPNKIEVPAGVEGKLVGISGQAQWLNDIREQIKELYANGGADQSAILERIAPNVPLADFPISYEDMKYRSS